MSALPLCLRLLVHVCVNVCVYSQDQRAYSYQDSTIASPITVHHYYHFITFIEPQGASHGGLNQPSPRFQADRPQSVKVYGRIQAHSNIMLILLRVRTEQ